MMTIFELALLVFSICGWGYSVWHWKKSEDERIRLMRRLWKYEESKE